MSFIEKFEADLREKIDNVEVSTDEIVRWCSERVLESYRNGISAGEKGAKVIRKGESRRSGAPSKQRPRQ